jgi:hypothetical protein
VDLRQTRPLSELEQQGLIHAFEFTHELAWNVMKDYFYHQGQSNITGIQRCDAGCFCGSVDP